MTCHWIRMNVPLKYKLSSHDNHLVSSFRNQNPSLLWLFEWNTVSVTGSFRVWWQVEHGFLLQMFSFILLPSQWYLWIYVQLKSSLRVAMVSECLSHLWIYKHLTVKSFQYWNSSLRVLILICKEREKNISANNINMVENYHKILMCCCRVLQA